MDISTKILSDITVYMKYARYIPEKKRQFGRTLKRRYDAGDPDVFQVQVKPKNIYVYYLNKKIKKKLLK